MKLRVLCIAVAFLALVNFAFANADVTFWYPLGWDCPGSVDAPLTYNSCFSGIPIPDGTAVEIYKVANPDTLVYTFAMNSDDICWDGEPNQGYFWQQTPISLLANDQVYVKVEYCGAYYYTSAFTLVSGYNGFGLQQSDWTCEVSNLCTTGYLTLLSSEPPNWGYRLHWVQGPIYWFCFSRICYYTTGFVNGDAYAQGWRARESEERVIFEAWELPFDSGSIDTFWLSAPYCDSGVVTWHILDSAGVIKGPIFPSVDNLVISVESGNVVLNWRSFASNFNIYGSTDPFSAGTLLDTETTTTWTDVNTSSRPSPYFYYVTVVE